MDVRANFQTILQLPMPKSGIFEKRGLVVKNILLWEEERSKVKASLEILTGDVFQAKVGAHTLWERRAAPLGLTFLSYVFQWRGVAYVREFGKVPRVVL